MPTRCSGSPPFAVASSSPTVLERVCELEPKQIEAALAEAVGRPPRRRVADGARVATRSRTRSCARRCRRRCRASRRVPLHLEIGEALEDVYAGELDRHLGELAHHFLEAAPLGQVERAVDYATRAAARARERLAYEDVRGALRRRRSTRSSSRPSPTAAAALDLLLELGWAQTTAARPDEARATLEQAAALARELGRPEELARRRARHLHAVDRRSRRRGADRAGRRRRSRRSARATARCGRSCSAASRRSSTGSMPPGARTSSGCEALEMARRLDDPDSLALALVRRQFTGNFGPEQTRRRMAESTELHDLAKARGDRELELRAHIYRLTATAGARGGPRGRRRAGRRRAPGDRAAPAPVAVERADAAGDAGADRRPLRRCRGRSPKRG